MHKNILTFKPDAELAAKRTEAYWNGDILDRPLMKAVLPKQNAMLNNSDGYYTRSFGDIDQYLADIRHNCTQMHYLGESFPSCWPSLGTHEIAQYCGYDVVWLEDKTTNWCKSPDCELEELLPLKIDEENYFWKRSVELYQKSTELFQGTIFPLSYDFHSNMDLLLSIRGDANLCLDLYDCPKTVKKALKDVCSIFEKLWNTYLSTVKGDQYGYYFELCSDKPTTVLACDFSALIGKEMFDEFALPALIYESEMVGDRAIYHWDGPDAIKHFDSLMAIKNLHTFSYVPSPGTYHYQFLELYQKVQEKGKGVVYGGTFEEIKEASKVLKPNLTVYVPTISTVQEFEEIEDWLIRHT